MGTRLEEWWRDEDLREPTMLISRGIRSLRKKRLVSAACVRRVLPLLPTPAFGAVVDAAEAFADGRIGWPAVLAARKRFRDARKPLLPAPVWITQALEAVRQVTEREPIVFTSALESAAWAVGARAAEAGGDEDKAGDREKEAQFVLMVDVTERPGVKVPPDWRTAAVRGLAESIYVSRDFGAMPVLADALEEAGCQHADVLAHCRGDGPHVRGCWVVDLILGKK